MLIFRSSKYDENSLKVAMQLQKNLQADMGGTEILKPLENVFKNRLSGCHSRQVIKSYIHNYQNISFKRRC